jgi:peptidoglycan/xylan/chitin deacetylase (PgdA/CDA1 family)
MLALLSALALVALSTVWSPTQTPKVASAEAPMFVLVSFDATPRGDVPVEEYHFIQLLERLRAAAPKEHSGTPPSFTLFFNTGLLQLPRDWTPSAESRWLHDARWQTWLKHPDQPRSRVIGHASDPDAILTSVETLFGLQERGVELASHGVQHQNGKGWTRAQWGAEFREHARILALHGLPTPAGFRAPFLKTSHPGVPQLSDPMFQVMTAYGMRYDSSKVGPIAPRWPTRIEGTRIWEVELPMYEGAKRPTLLFGPSAMGRWGLFYLLREEFERRYHGDRAPLVYGGHGEFVDTVERFLTSVCYQPDVRCVTYSEFVRYLDRQAEVQGRPVTPTAPDKRAGSPWRSRSMAH